MILAGVPDSTKSKNEGLADVKSGLAQAISGSLQTLDSYLAYRAADIISFSSQLKNFIPEVWNWLENTVKEEFRFSIRTLSENHALAEVRKDMAELMEIILNK